MKEGIIVAVIVCVSLAIATRYNKELRNIFVKGYSVECVNGMEYFNTGYSVTPVYSPDGTIKRCQ